jgi:hypothetical protein
MAILPSVCLLDEEFQAVVAEHEKWLMDATDIKYLVQRWRTKYDSREDLMININLGVDATSCKPELFSSGQRGFGGSSGSPHSGTDPETSENEKKMNSFFPLLAMPIDPNKVHFPLHVQLHQSRDLCKDQAHSKVMEIMTELNS